MREGQTTQIKYNHKHRMHTDHNQLFVSYKATGYTHVKAIVKAEERKGKEMYHHKALRHKALANALR